MSMQAVRPVRGGYQVGLLGMLMLGGLLEVVQARSLTEIQQSKEFRVCIVPVHPAYAEVTPPECWEQCTFTGPVYEEVVAFAATLGAEVQLKVRRVVFDAMFHNQEGVTVREASYTPALLASGTCDVYPTHLTKTAWRLTKLDIVTLFPSRMMVIVNTAAKGQFHTAADLAGKVAAVEKDTSQHSWLQDQNTSTYAANPVRIILMPFNDGVRAVDAGEVDFTLLDTDAAIWSTRHQFKQAMVVFPVGPTEEIGWGFRKDDKDLQAAVQAFFETQKAMATSPLNQIWERAFGLTLTKFERLVRATQ
jgi:membrane-bound lytic murein transglycosylase MltF